MHEEHGGPAFAFYGGGGQGKNRDQTKTNGKQQQRGKGREADHHRVDAGGIGQGDPEWTHGMVAQPRKQSMHTKPYCKVSDHAHDGGGDCSQCALKTWAGGEPVDPGGGGENPKKTGHKGHPKRHTSRSEGQRVAALGMPGLERHKLSH